MRKFILSIKLLTTFIILFSFPSAQANPGDLLTAISRGDSNYFKKISYKDLIRSDRPHKKTSQIQKHGIASLSALSGIFENPDPKSRRYVYKLLFSLPVDEGKGNPESIKHFRSRLFRVKENNSKNKLFLSHLYDRYNCSLREALLEKNYLAIARMSSGYFERSNRTMKKTAVGSLGGKSITTLLRALRFKETNSQTKEKIIESLYFKEIGGISSAIHKESLKIKRSENILRLVDLEESDDIKLKLLDLSEAYADSFLTTMEERFPSD